jgi:hypothetical protein
MGALTDSVLDVVLSPTLWMCVLFGVVYAVLFSIWRGGGPRQWLHDIIAGVLGFALGQLTATLFHLPTLMVGQVHLLWGSLFAVLALLVGRRYWRPRPSARPPSSAPAP